jgi:hypothetical protein
MVHTFTATPREDHERYLSGWVDFVVRHRVEKESNQEFSILSKLKTHVRWENGHKFLFPDGAPMSSNSFEDEDEEEELDEDSE